jgi:hypothetical protein
VPGVRIRHWPRTGRTIFVPLVRHVMADRRNGTYAYSRSGTLCFSARFHAGRFVALTASYWMARGAGYELTGADVCAARDHALVASEALGVGALVNAGIADNVAGDGASARWARQCLGLGADAPSEPCRLAASHTERFIRASPQGPEVVRN